MPEVMVPAHRMRQALPRGESWRDSQSTSLFLGSNRYIISTARQKLNSIQFLPRGGYNITSFLEVLHGEVDLRT